MKEIASLGGDIDKFVHPNVAMKLKGLNLTTNSDIYYKRKLSVDSVQFSLSDCDNFGIPDVHVHKHLIQF